MALAALAGEPTPNEMLVDSARLGREYDAREPDRGGLRQLVIFGASGHRGSSHYRPPRAEFEAPGYTRGDAPATPEQEARRARLSPEMVHASSLGGVGGSPPC